MGSALDDERVARRVSGPLGAGVLVRFQRIAAGKNPSLNYVFELSLDGSLRIARHSGVVGDWRTPMDASLPTSPNGSAPAKAVKKVSKLLSRVSAESSPSVVEGDAVKDGVFEVVTLPPEQVVVYDGVDNDVLRELRKLADSSS